MVRLKHPIMKGLYEVLLVTGFEGSYILNVYQEKGTLKVNIKLPKHSDLDDLDKILNNLKMEMNALDVKIGKVNGKKVELLFGMGNLEKINVRKNIKNYLNMNSLKISLPSSYGHSILDFEDGASCHLLNGGTTRMGKTCLLLYLCCLLYIQNNGYIQFLITSTKIKDFYPFEGLPGVKMAETEEELHQELLTVIDEYKKRKELLKSPTLRKATDSKSVKKIYPHLYHYFRPIMVIIDEYARFSDNREIQKQVMELVETAGSYNVHVIIASQRPDARSVLPPRIKTNLLARICFTTADKNNSVVILDDEGAEKLGKIPGRAIYLDSDKNIIQVPYLDASDCDRYLSVYRKDVNKNEQTGKRSVNPSLSNKISDMFKESTSSNGVQRKQ